MSKNRMEAFSDGVVAIIITIMVLELTPPHGPNPAELRPLLPVFFSYVLSFVNLGIYWNNHHHMLQAVKQVDGRTLWANMHLLFWLSLIPFASAWMGENPITPWPVALYGAVLLLAAVAYNLLSRALIALNGRDSTLASAVGRDFKGKISLVFYLAAVPLAFISPWIAIVIYVLIAAWWLIPDRRIERVVLHD